MVAHAGPELGFEAGGCGLEVGVAEVGVRGGGAVTAGSSPVVTCAGNRKVTFLMLLEEVKFESKSCFLTFILDRM